jgi:hypothetical protein
MVVKCFIVQAPGPRSFLSSQPGPWEGNVKGGRALIGAMTFTITTFGIITLSITV